VILATVHRREKLGRAASNRSAGFLELLGIVTRTHKPCCSAAPHPTVREPPRPLLGHHPLRLLTEP